MTKNEILKSAHEGRIQEVMGYQINIDNYTLALKMIEEANDPDLVGFKEQLESLLKTEIVEQKKAKIMLAVIAQQIEEE